MKKRYVLFLIPLILYVAILGALPQMEPDEARYSVIASEMNTSGNYVTPQIKHTIYLEKPPLSAWMTALAFKVFGENDFSARLFTGLCAWGCILLVFWIGRHFRDEKTGLYAAAILSVSAFPFILGRIHILDMPLTLFLSLAIWLGYLALTAGKKRYLYGLYVACALAFLTKGLIGVVFPFAILVFWLLWAGRWRHILKLISPVGILIFLVVACPWLYLAHKENADFLWFFFVREHFMRFTTKMHGKTEPFFFFVPIILGGALPWLVYLLRAWRPSALRFWLFSKEENKLLVVWFLFIFLFFTVSSSKLAPYVAPVFLPIALFAGSIFRHYEETLEAPSGWQKRAYRFFVYFQSAVIMIGLLVPVVLKQFSDPAKGLVVMISGNWWFYMLPAFVAAALLVFLPDLVARKKGKKWFVTLYLTSALLLAGTIPLLYDFLAPYRSALVVKEAIADHVPPDKLLYQYRENFYGIDFYNKIRTAVVEDFGELRDGIGKMPEEERRKYFLLRSDFFDKIGRKEEIYCVTQHKDKLSELSARTPRMEILWDNGAFYLVRFNSNAKDE